MQLGEGLHLLNLVAANCLTSLVFDRDMLEQFCGADLPWSSSQAVARMGVEYRNDLLGHVHALGPSAPPSRYFTGHDRCDHPEDWPPNKAGCEELRAHARESRLRPGHCHGPGNPAAPDGSSVTRIRGHRIVTLKPGVRAAASQALRDQGACPGQGRRLDRGVQHRLAAPGLRHGAGRSGRFCRRAAAHADVLTCRRGRRGRASGHLGT